MKQREVIEILEVLACDVTARPRSAPTFEEVSVYVRTTSREPDAVVIAFDPAGLEDVRALVAAESLCCATMRWELEESAGASCFASAGRPRNLMSS